MRLPFSRLVPLLAGWMLSLPSAAAPPGAERPLPPAVATALAQAKVPRDAVAFLVQPLDDTAPRLAHRVDAAMNPASVMKMVTTLAALDQLGPGFTWKTRFYADGPVADGVLHGNLYIEGGGDPKLVLERVDSAFRTLQAAGVRQVRGDMVLDNSIFDVPTHDPAAFDNEPLRPYNVAPDGLLVNFKALILRFTPQADGTALVTSEPPLTGVVVPDAVPLARNQACGDWRSALQADFSDPNAVHLQGDYPARCGERDWAVAYVEPSSYAQRALLALFRAAGGQLDGSARQGRRPANARLLLEAPSLPLAEVIADVNKRSNNVMAQQLLLTLAAQRRLPARMEDGRAAIAAWWRRFVGSATPGPLLENGAGLSRDERISASALARMLARASRHAEAATYLQSLSLAGVDGTTERMRERGLAHVVGNAWLKTGSLRDVASVAGYVRGRSGQRYVVVAMINHANALSARPALDSLLEWAAEDDR
ncbi:MAG: D-alanyl-D-alanine carboxypeptidase/D-alanyl-D-alanine-endopeptidase [Variovorax paradoxus]|nr:MAG: D-alanyl-D-alanine carboxypeptidase/D-alanyl-D-alanine-endopeptidase [Variovorax paradoxus]PZQ10328.1 MAG: D-alanyl-D-alanine carboxypeptidase/D-alanyl-D-alanine-endopeptidase [Variovorax paradoxus]